MTGQTPGRRQPDHTARSGIAWFAFDTAPSPPLTPSPFHRIFVQSGIVTLGILVAPLVGPAGSRQSFGETQAAANVPVMVTWFGKDCDARLSKQS